ncbi:RING-H2 finger protein ATL40-like [Juglans microcarpa x Juglans regia]|uniref:RING-H2 finger protein ATL40-like n=1 Tax=Juglans microcarpa x Juglans regia TaxID=2249226 RepID=UPI001B7F5078|nr:RING-H2 finger protein ATL40-like [Juglans microcarpa x Juglans regia]
MEIFISVMLLFGGIVVLIVIHVCIAGRVRRRGNNQGDHDHNHTMVTIGNDKKTMSNDDLKRLPCFEYKVAEKGNTSSVDCAVCLENFKMGDQCRLLPNCRHSFHVQCIDSWVLKTPVCPICRTCANPTSR